MKELKDILARFSSARSRAVLATVVKTQGSTYRRPGARMLIEEDGQTVGLVSGGCLDSDLLEHARDVLKTNTAKIVGYDSTSDVDSIWGLGLGCPGRVLVLLEPSDSTECQRVMDFIESRLNSHSVGVIATVIRSESMHLAKVPSRALITASDILANEISHEQLKDDIIRDARSALTVRQSTHRIYEHADASVELFFEVIHPPTSLMIFGAGPDAVPVCRLASELGWDITVIDHRSAFARKEHFPDAAAVVLTEVGRMPERVFPTPETVALIMTHNYSHDAFYLKHLLQSPIRYIGLLGPTTKSNMIFQKLRQEGFSLTEEQIARVYTPVGLDIGAETPEEIALAIISEIQSVMSNRRGGFLRERKGPIH